jgi:hypothetical protein
MRRVGSSTDKSSYFYTCPLPRENPERCKFFKWEDELVTPKKGGNVLGSASGSTPGVSRAAALAAATNRQGLAQPPATSTSTSRPISTPSALRHYPAPHTPSTTARKPVEVGDRDHGVDGDEEGVDGEINWDQVDTGELEREAVIASTPSTQRTMGSVTPSESLGRGGSTFSERLRGAVGETSKKRAYGDTDDGPTPKRVATDINVGTYVSSVPMQPGPRNRTLTPAEPIRLVSHYTIARVHPRPPLTDPLDARQPV